MLSSFEPIADAIPSGGCGGRFDGDPVPALVVHAVEHFIEALGIKGRFSWHLNLLAGWAIF